MNPPNIEILPTNDGSVTLYLTGMEETYHSRHGAMRESMHVYVRSGVVDVLISLGFLEGELLLVRKKESLQVFEMGFGTGLNAWLLDEFCRSIGLNYSYVGIEKYPLPKEFSEIVDFGFGAMGVHWRSVNRGLGDGIFNDGKGETYRERWKQLFDSSYTEVIGTNATNENTILKVEGDVLVDLERVMPMQTSLVFWDAFAPKKQPELWTTELFTRVRARMREGGMLVTYTANSQVRRNMLAAGFRVERIAGPPQKKHMLRAWKD